MRRSTRWMLLGGLLTAAVTLGFAVMLVVYDANRNALRGSELLGRLVCGEGQRVDDVPASRRGRRFVCQDAAGREVSARNNLVAVTMALPFVVLLVVPAALLALLPDWRETGRR